MGNKKYLESISYSSVTEKISQVINQDNDSGENFAVYEAIAVMKAVLNSLEGHEEEKAALVKYNITDDFEFEGGCKIISKLEILKHVPDSEHWRSFITSRHSIRKFTDKIISTELIREIIRDAEFYPSACNRQPCKVYYSQDRNTISEMLKYCDNFVTRENGIYNCFIITCDTNLFHKSELNDQELLNSGIFLGCLVLSIHAHGLGSCLFQFLQANTKRHAEIRQKFGISENEIVACFIGFGELQENIITACSQRRPVESIAINLDTKIH